MMNSRTCEDTFFKIKSPVQRHMLRRDLQVVGLRGRVCRSHGWQQVLFITMLEISWTCVRCSIYCAVGTLERSRGESKGLKDASHIASYSKGNCYHDGTVSSHIALHNRCLFYSCILLSTPQPSNIVYSSPEDVSPAKRCNNSIRAGGICTL
jgi:hypothetical protein